jgi:hypothetical protein
VSTVAAYARSNWLGLAGIGIGVAGIAVGVYLYKQSLEERDPIFVVDPNRIEIVKAERVATAPIKVLRRNGSPIQADIYAVRFFLWNAGKRSIRPENVLDTIRITLDSGNEILDFRTLKASRPITHARLIADPPGAASRTLAVVFSILERDDGLSGQVIYQGKPDAALTVSGVIEGVARGIGTPQAPSFWTIAQRHLLGILLQSGAFLFVLPAVVVYRRRKSHLPVRWAKAVGVGVSAAIGVLVMSLVLAFFNQLDTPHATVVAMVPPQLLM